MRKKIITAALTVGVATALIAGNGIMTTYASANADAQKVKVVGKHQQPDMATAIAGPGSKPGIQIKHLSVNEKVAVVTAEKAIQEKFKVSLSGYKITYDLSTRVDMKGTFYFVTFVDSELVELSDDKIIEAKGKVKAGKSHGYKSDVYIAFVNAKTGKVVSVEKNPTAPKGAN